MFFAQRDFPLPVVQKGLERARLVPRDTALKPSSFTSKVDDDRPTLIIPFHPHLLPVKRIILDNWSILKDDPTLGDLFSSIPRIAYSRMPNIRDTLVRSRLRPPGPLPAYPIGMNRCSKSMCRACPYLWTQPLVPNPNGVDFRIKRSFHCQLENLVYVILCQRCGKIYIGETKFSLEHRFSQHLGNIRRDDGTPVSNHFLHSQGHSKDDMRVSVIWKIHGDTVDRKVTESWLISTMNTMEPFGLNKRP